MQISRLDHVNIRTSRLDAMISWYTKILGLRNGDRPEFPFGGAWLYAASETAVVHLVLIDEANAVGSEASLKLEHFSLKASGAEEFEARLNQAAEKYRRVELPEVDLVLYNVWDPDGNHIHVDFPLSEHAS